MKKLAVSLGLITSAIMNASVFPASAQTVNDGSCLGAVGEGSIIQPVDDRGQVISVGRKARRVIGRIGNGESLLQFTCENEDRQVKFFTASLAIPDGAGLKKAQFIFYLDGKIVRKVNLVQGAVATIAIDNIYRSSSYAYDIKQVDGCCFNDQIRILKWQVIKR
jgi:hypothetical protein